MAWREQPARRLGLRPRFLMATALLVVTAVTASLWTLGALSRLSHAVGETLRQNDEATRATAEIASAIEREDDALLLVLTGDANARTKLEGERRNADQALEHLDDVLNAPPEQELVDALRAAMTEYRSAADIIAEESPGSLVHYHRDVNPLLRRAVNVTARLRDRYFESTQSMATQAHEEVVGARRVALAISLVALLVSVLLALHLARLVIVPLTEMTKGVHAMTRENFEQRLKVRSRDELGDLAIAFNEMAEHLAEFRRSNLGETLRAKSTLEATLQALPDAVILLSDQGRILAMNRRAHEILDRPSEGAEAPVVPTVGGIALSSLADATEGPTPTEPVDLAKVVCVEIDGSTRKLLPRALRLADPREIARDTILVLYDVTEIREARRDARGAHRGRVPRAAYATHHAADDPSHAAGERRNSSPA